MGLSSLIYIPLLSAFLAFFLKGGNSAKIWALLSSVITLVVTLLLVFQPANSNLLHVDAPWLPMMGSRFTLSIDGMGKILTLLTAVSFPIIFGSIYSNSYKDSNAFYGFMLLTQAGLMGVFCSMDLLLFYFFWELALIPTYFLCSKWGGDKRIQVTFKFFIYTFIGSLLMLVGILFIYYRTADHSFAYSSLQHLQLSSTEQNVMFLLFFVAFAIKMPIFPLHTWQPDTYEQSPTAVTMVLSGVMVKMGVYGVIRWLLPIFPEASIKMADSIMILSVVGMVYASLIAIKQDDIKRLIAYSSIAHIGLMAASMFANNATGMQGVIIQMFAHGINIIGLWIVVDVIEKQTGTRKLSELGGLAMQSPSLAILFVVLCFANIALPLTNSFVGEFLMFNSLYQHNAWLGAIAGLTIIFAAVYTLWMVQKAFYGEAKPGNTYIIKLPANTQMMLIVLVIFILVFGVYPQPMIDLTNDTVTKLIAHK